MAKPIPKNQQSQQPNVKRPQLHSVNPQDRAARNDNRTDPSGGQSGQTGGNAYGAPNTNVNQTGSANRESEYGSSAAERGGENFATNNNPDRTQEKTRPGNETKKNESSNQ